MLNAIIIRLAVLLGFAPSRASTDINRQPLKLVATPMVPTVSAWSANGSADNVPTIHLNADGPADPIQMVGRAIPIATTEAAVGFMDWMRRHEPRDRAWTVDEVWYLASEDFAVAAGVVLPPRNRFLGALQKQAGVSVQYDKRIRPGAGAPKTTFYRFAKVEGTWLAPERSGVRALAA